MSKYIEPQHMIINDLPGIWTPVDGESLTEDERIFEIEEQARASLLSGVDTPEAIIRMLLNETDIMPTNEPPLGYDPEIQGEWDEDRLTFKFKRACWIQEIDRQPLSLYIEYVFEDLGVWTLEIGEEEVRIYK